MRNLVDLYVRVLLQVQIYLTKLHYVSVFTLQMLTDIARFVLTRNDDVHIHIYSDWFLENTHIVGYITRIVN